MADPAVLGARHHSGRPCRSSGIELDPPLNGAEFAVVADPARGRYFRLGLRQYELLRLCDGNREIPDLYAAAGANSPEAEQIIDGALGKFYELGLLATDEESSHSRRDPKWGPLQVRVRGLKDIRIEFLHPERIFERLAEGTRSVGARRWGVTLVCLMAGSSLAVWAGAEELRAYAGFDPASTFKTALLLGWMFIWLHEVCHGIVLAHLGGRVRAIGFALFYFRPSLFCDANDAWRLRSNRQRAYVASAGIAFHFVSALILVGMAGALAELGAGFTAVTLCMNLATFNISTGIFNLIPFVKMDGYWILSSCLDRPRLRQESIDAWKAEARQGLGINSQQREPTDDRGSVLFGLVSSLFGPALMGVSVLWFVELISRAGIIGPVFAICVELLLATYLALLAYRALQRARGVRIVSPGNTALSAVLLSVAVTTVLLSDVGGGLVRVAITVLSQPWGAL